MAFDRGAEEGPTRIYTLNVTRQTCSDGMSDREFGWAASLFIESPDGNQMLTGLLHAGFAALIRLSTRAGSAGFADLSA